MTRIVMVGAGGVARRHVRVLAGLDGVRIEAVVDPDVGAAELLSRDCGARAWSDLDAALDDVRPDAVYVCVPPFAHGAPERAALERGLPFFVEKPVAVGIDVAEEIAARVAERGLVTGTGYHWRCLDTVEHARDLLAGRPPLLAIGSWLDKRPPVAWWPHRDRSGGQVVEQLTHLVDLARAVLGEAHEVYAAGARRPDAGPDAGPDEEDATRGDIDDATAAVVRFSSGAVATFAATSLLRAKQRTSLQVVGDGVHLELSEEALVVDDGEPTRTMTPRVDPRVEVDREFVAAVRGERADTRAPYAEALRTQRLCHALVSSAVAGRPEPVGP